ncbi:MAG TPA: M20/M25/M40 family metallo-hydrolase [Steroidobacteraceae bacterium]|nr:M20/M25/M40 family metallo-hydrolase [Steroidobacteraceae bacterium]
MNAPVLARLAARCALLAGITLMAPLSAGEAGLSAAEKRIVTAATAENASALALLERLVNINSGTMNFAGVEQVGRIMMSELQNLGFEARWVPMNAVNRAGHVVAEHKGSGRGRRLLLIGHLDTVFEKDSPFQKFERRGDSAEGPGVNDMKDGLAIMVSALRAMRAAGTLRDADITIVLNGDEERAGEPISVSRAELLSAATHSDVALEFEALATEDGRDMGSVSRRGSMTWNLRATAPSGHSSGIFSAEAGYGAVYELTRILDDFRRELREPNATYNVGLVLGGATAAMNSGETGGQAAGKSNVIAAEALARGDLRTLSNEQTLRMQTKMRDIVARHLAGTQATITFEKDPYPAMPPTAGNRALLAELNGINRDLGLAQMPELDPLKRGAGDISFVADKVDGLVGFGAVGKGSHAPGETVDLTSFDRQIKRTALLMTRLSRRPRG